MTTTAVAPTVTTTPPDARTRRQLAALAVGFPLWAAVSVAQAATREGFDILRHPLSLLSTGDLGWLQITNFVVAGVLAVVGARGLRTALRGTPGGVWAPRLVAAAGIGLLAAGPLVMDPGANFPVGAPDDLPLVSWHAVGHMVAGTVSFTALIAACFVLARHLTRDRTPGSRDRLPRRGPLPGARLGLGDGRGRRRHADPRGRCHRRDVRRRRGRRSGAPRGLITRGRPTPPAHGAPEGFGA